MKIEEAEKIRAILNCTIVNNIRTIDPIKEIQAAVHRSELGIYDEDLYNESAVYHTLINRRREFQRELGKSASPPPILKRIIKKAPFPFCPTCNSNLKTNICEYCGNEY